MVKHQSPSPSPATIGVAYYKPEQWQQLLAVSVDKDKLQGTYAEWVKDAERLIKELRRKGFRIAKVDVTIEELVAWCQSQNIPVNGESRSRYAAYKLKQSSG